MSLDPRQTHVLHEWKHGRPLIACCFDPTGQFLFTSSEDYSLQRWNLADGSKTAWPAHDSWIRDIAFLPDGKTVVTAGCDDRMILWPVTGDSPQPMAEVVAHQGWVRSVAVNQDGTLIATGGNDRLVRLWSPDGKPVRELAGHEGHVYSVFFHPDGSTLLSGDLKGVVHQWDTATGSLTRSFEAKDLFTYNKGQQVDYGGVRDIAMSPDGKTIAVTGLHKASNPLGAVNEPLVILFDWATGEVVRKQPADGVRGVGWQVEFLADGSEVCASGGSGGGYLIFFNPGEEKPFHQFKLKDTARDMSLHPDGLQVATAHWDGHVRICRMKEKASM